jgi:hypothetical protein
MGTRYYAPTLMRWTQQDPIEQPTDPVQANAYGYAGADPINLTDPEGTLIPAIAAGLSVVARAAPVIVRAAPAIYRFARAGREITSRSVGPGGGANWRIAPFGNRGAGPLARKLPHYHRRGPGGIGRHRPWERGPGGWRGRF